MRIDKQVACRAKSWRHAQLVALIATLALLTGCTSSHERWSKYPNCGVGPTDLVSPPQAVCLAISVASQRGDDFPDMAYVDRIGHGDDSALWVVRVEQAGADETILQGGTVDGATVFLEARGGKVLSYQKAPFQQRKP
jgi:hypothetical protein